MVAFIFAGIFLMLIAFGSVLVFFSTLVWTRDLEVKSDGAFVIEHLREVRRQQALDPPDAGTSTPPDASPQPSELPEVPLGD